MARREDAQEHVLGDRIGAKPADVAAFEKLIEGLDVPAERVQEVRQVRIASGDPAQVVAKADGLYKQSTRAENEPVTASLEPESRMVTVVGTAAGLAAYTDLLRSVESSVVVERETKSIVLKQARPSGDDAKRSNSWIAISTKRFAPGAKSQRVSATCSRCS